MVQKFQELPKKAIEFLKSYQELVGFVFSLATSLGPMATNLTDPWRANYQVFFWLACVVGACLLTCAFFNFRKIIQRWLDKRRPPLPPYHNVRLLLFLVSLLPLILVYLTPLKTRLVAFVGRTDTIALVVVGENLANVHLDVSDLQDLLAKKTGIQVVSPPIPQASSSPAYRGWAALETFRKNNGFGAAFWVEITPSSQGDSTKVDLTIRKTPYLNWKRFAPLTEDENYSVPDVSTLLSMSILEYVSIKKCQKEEYGLVLDMARNWLEKASEQRCPLLLKRPAYLITLAEADYEADYNVLGRDEGAICGLYWGEIELPELETLPDTQLLMALTDPGRLLVENAKFDQAEEVLRSRIDTLEDSDKANAYRLLGEVSLARFQVETRDSERRRFLEEAIRRFTSSDEFEQGAPETFFGLGRTHFLQALIVPDSVSSSRLLQQSIKDLEAVQGGQSSSCLKRNSLLWLSAAYAIDGRMEDSQVAFAQAQAIECKARGMITLDTPVTSSDSDLTVRLVLPDPKQDYWVSVLDANPKINKKIELISRTKMEPIDPGLPVYSATLDLQYLFHLRFDEFAYDQSRVQLMVLLNCQLAVYLSSEPPNHALVPTFPLLLVADARLHLEPEIPKKVVLSPDEELALTASIQGPPKDAASALVTPAVLEDKHILDQFRLFVLFTYPNDREPLEMARSEKQGQYNVSFDVYSKADDTGDLTLKVVVFDASLLDKGIKREVLASDEISFQAITPTPTPSPTPTPTLTPTPSPTPTPTPTPTPDLREQQVAILSEPIIYESPFLDAEIAKTISLSCPIVIVNSPNLDDWYSVMYSENDAWISGWVPETSVGVDRTLTREAIEKNLAVTTASTDLYSSQTLTDTMRGLTECTLLEIRKPPTELDEGWLYVWAHLASHSDPQVGYVLIRDVKRRPIPVSTCPIQP